MLHNEIFAIVKKHIDKMDYISLLESGAPDDEFDIESKEISKRINIEISAREIAEIIADVFNTFFAESDDANKFLSVAEQIKKDTTL